MAAVIPEQRLGACSWSLQPSNAASLVEALSRLELNAVQLALVPLLEQQEAWGDALDRLEAAGIRVASGMLEAVGEDYSTLESIKRTGGLLPDDTWPGTRDRAERVAELAGAAGIGLVTLHAGFVPHDPGDPQRATVLRRLEELADRFHGSAVRVGLETGQENATTLNAALDELDHPNVGVNFDPANMILYGMGDPVEALRMLGERVVQVHAKDALPSAVVGEWGAEVPLGQGAVDWDAFLAEVLALPASPDVLIEREAGEARELDISQARARLLGLSVPNG
ncbi:MAG: sugar phosphate isomerase/epimerase [Phycisphaerales bacterium]|nr:sugar phosphate isomerase/epimerase [Phycisphaerales bacterium]